ncbi:MAG: HlyD family efflux transporter periplasmic adaptor subunit [Armatimonadia bacterium]
MLLVLLGIALYVFLSGSDASARDSVRASGLVEARTIELSSEVSGMIVERPIEKGQPVHAGQLIATIASETTAAELRRAEATLVAASDQATRADAALALQQGVSAGDIEKAAAGVGTAVAREADIAAGSRKQEIEAAQAAVHQAAGVRDAARAQLRELQAGLRPEEVRQAEDAYEAATAQVASARSTLADLEAGARQQELEQARALVNRAEAAAEKAGKDYRRGEGLVRDGAIPPSQMDALRAANESAQADLKAAREQLALLRAGTRTDQIAAARGQLQRAVAQQRSAQEALSLARQGPRREELDRAAAALRQAEGTYAAADANLRLALAGARPGQRETARRQVTEARAALRQARENQKQIPVRIAEAQAARAQVVQAEAAVASARASLDKFRLTAPSAGMIDDTHLRVGEIVKPGSSIATMVDFTDTWVTVYVPEPMLSRLVIGQSATVTVDGLPDRNFSGTIRRIAQQAEFTPKFVQTYEERTRTVFAVEIAVSNEQGLLKPGMPADAVIQAAPEKQALQPVRPHA